ncbi:hypothetical protein B0H17DRAFT_1104324 [Mycena rosella]|uniref:Uncharacterized protein n=1 Tax=Mycena rosella TaxID=1033263 RepID=A0AAD7CD93_MYCRO|nr:hypothetical protein B0H17DRAFT_1104324 [Mycena rosella]
MPANAYPANFKPNFDSAFNVTLPFPLATVFLILGTDDGLGPHILLSSLASDFEVLAKDSVAVTGNLEDAFARTAPSGDGFPRQAFKYKETMKIVPGLTSLDVIDRKLALYETSSDKGVVIRKIRHFEEVDGGASTQVSETIDGQCPALLQIITQTSSRKAHKEQMNLYHTLFA